MAKRSPEQILDALDAWDQDDAIDAEMERILARTPEERENDLRAAGIDVEAERTKAREWREKAARGEIPAIAKLAQPAAVALPAPSSQAKQPQYEPASAIPVKPASIVGKTRVPMHVRWAALLAAATVGLIVGALAMPVAEMVRGPDISPYADKAGSPMGASAYTVAELRRMSFEACDAQRWDACLWGLDLARKRDPDGDKDARVREYRQRAESARRR
jgi:hypothetical protein